MSSVELAAALRERYPRVAISHEWLTVPGGSEKVVRAILELVGHAEIFTTVYEPNAWTPDIRDRPVHPSFLNRIPGATRHYPKLLPLMDTAFRSFDLSGFDLVISSNHACAKNVRVPDGVPHVCYCHTPMRYVWDPVFLDGENLGRAGRAVFDVTLPMLRRTDQRGARGVDRFAANSTVVADRIRRFYGRDAEVIHPPVDVEHFATVQRDVAPDAPYLIFGRVVPYKRVDLAVQACRRLGRPLIVAGTGRHLDHVRSLAGEETTFEGHVSDERLRELLATCRALIFCGEEDFGIVPVEAQAAGMPVIGYSIGGVRDSVLDGRTGVLYDDGGGLDALCAAIERFESLDLDPRIARDHAGAFAPEIFTKRFGDLLLRAGG